MGRRLTQVIILTVIVISASAFASRGSEGPPRQANVPGFWASGVKQAFGTAYEAYDHNVRFSDESPTAPLSKVWFTAAQGVLSEVFWPSADTAQVRDSQFLVTDGHSFFFDERTMAVSTVSWLKPGVPAFRIVNRDPESRFEIERILFADPDRNVVVQRIKITRTQAGLKFYLHHNPSVGNTPFGDNALVGQRRGHGNGMFAWQDNHAQALVASLPIKLANAGMEGTATDGFLDLKDNFKLDAANPSAWNGNVVLTGELDLPPTAGVTVFDLALGFGASVEEAQKAAWESLNRRSTALLEKYTSQWQMYHRGVRDLSGATGDGGNLFWASVAIMKSLEDKTRSGAYIASPGVPWGLNQADWNAGPFLPEKRRPLVSGYHIVWPRDLYQMATSFLAMDDGKSALASLNYLKAIQYGPGSGEWHFGSRVRAKDGSFPQNCWIDGENHWGGVQLDEVGMPIVLAARLWKKGLIPPKDYWDMVRRAADFIADFGPWSPQERWEEVHGLSPSTIAAEIAGLRDAATFAEDAGDTGRAERYRTLADSWNKNLTNWAFTTTGKWGDGRYYERIEGASALEQLWDPNDEIKFKMANGSGLWREKDVVDGGFLELVRFGIKRALSYDIQESIPEYDQTIRVDFPGIGTSFRRYLGDRYNYDEETNEQTLGMPWPLLTGERAHFELAAGVEKGLPAVELDAIVNPHIYAMEAFATPSLMIPEQVWDFGPRAAKPTGAATPLGWAHGEYVKLLRSRLDRRVFDLESLDVGSEFPVSIP